MSEDRKCPKCGEDLRLVEDNNRTSVGGVLDTSVVLLWKCPKCEVRIRRSRRLDGELSISTTATPSGTTLSLTHSDGPSPVRIC
jgi:predicted RNA-binding Zn-ribbon protein involved in translation (DUF1610 family)